MYCDLNSAIDKIKDLCLDGLRVDGEHHKQWYLEQILKALADSSDYKQDWEDGIAP